MFALRGVWSLGIFLLTNWLDLASYYRKNERIKAVSSATNDNNLPSSAVTAIALLPPKEEEELVQLNIALQKEIVKFTAVGIQRAVREIDDLIYQQASSSSHGGSTSRTSSLATSFNFFVSFVFLIFFTFFFLSLLIGSFSFRK
jgi:hypothetical protein